MSDTAALLLSIGLSVSGFYIGRGMQCIALAMGYKVDSETKKK